MGWGILEDKHLDNVPGTVLLADIRKDNYEPNVEEPEGESMTCASADYSCSS